LNRTLTSAGGYQDEPEGRPWWSDQLVRGPPYFACHLHIYNGLLSFYKPCKNPNKSNLLFASTVLNLLPNLSEENICAPVSGGIQSAFVDEFPLDPALWQAIQALLDTRIPMRFLNILVQADLSTQITILKITLRSLLCCFRAPTSWRNEDPLWSLGQELTTLPWLVAILQILKDRSVAVTSELFHCGLKILRLMSLSAHWMRHWLSVDVIPFLSMTRKRLQGLASDDERKVILESILFNLHLTNGGALINTVLKYRSSNDILSSKRPVTLDTLLHEANDLSFGSTLNEQIKFTESLIRWVNSATSVGSQLIESAREDGSDRAEFWEKINSISIHICHWLPSLTLPLEIEDRDKDRQTRALLSADVIIKQLIVIETLLVSALASCGESAVGLVVSCLWSKSRHGVEGNPTGLLILLTQMETAPALVEKFLSVRVEIQIMSTLCGVLSATPPPAVHLLCEIGVVTVCCQFLRHCVAFVQKIVKRAGLHKEFHQFHATLVSSWRKVWGTLLRGDSVVHTALLDSGILSQLICEWLGDATTLAPQHVKSPSPMSSLIIRREVVSLLRAFCLYKPRIERILFQTTRHILESSVISSELEKLNSEKTIRGSSAIRVSALHILALLAELDLEEIDIKLKVSTPPLCLH
jgi:aryl carrier-like protein